MTEASGVYENVARVYAGVSGMEAIYENGGIPVEVEPQLPRQCCV